MEQFGFYQELDIALNETDNELSFSEESDSSGDEDTHDWLQWGSNPFSPTIPPFTGSRGPKIEVPDSVKGCVDLFLSDELFENIATQTNLFATDFLANSTPTVQSRFNEWKQVASYEIRHFVALSILMGINTLPSIPDYWSTSILFHNPAYSAVMSRNRFQLISKFIHFADNTYYNSQDPYEDRLYKIRPLLNYLVGKFQEVYSPSQKVSVFEQILPFNRNIPSKKSSLGIKVFSLCDSSGYLVNVDIYTGKKETLDTAETDCKTLGLTDQTVLQLMQPILDKGHMLFVDSRFTSPLLFKLLINHGTTACGIVKKHRAQFPPQFTSKKMKSGESSHVVSDNLIGLRYRDKRSIYYLSTMHRPKLVPTMKKNRKGESVTKEQLVEDYNKNRGNLERNETLTNQHTFVRKCQKWSTKIAFHMFEAALFNAHVLYTVDQNRTMRYAEFKLAYVKSILEGVPRYTMIAENSSERHQSHQKQHFPMYVPMKNPKYTSPTKRCVHCYKKGQRKHSRYQCDSCVNNPGLCVDPCFREFHSK